MSFGAYHPVEHEYRRPCVILPDPRSDDTPTFKCNAPSGLRTILDYPICDDCFLAVSL
jgi:hypothetical protein